MPDTGKVASMQALLADYFSENCGHFWINNIFCCRFCSSMATSLYYYLQVIHFRLKIFDLFKKKCNLGHFCMLRI